VRAGRCETKERKKIMPLSYFDMEKNSTSPMDREENELISFGGSET
jgi:hypothetical protein